MDRNAKQSDDVQVDYTQVEVGPGDSFEDVARALAAAAPASAVYDGVEVQVEAGQTAEDVVRKYVAFRRDADLRRRLGGFAISTVQIRAAKSPGPGGAIDPWREILDPRVGQLYVLHEQRADFTVGNVAVVACIQAENKTDGRRAPALHLQHGPVVAALGSLLVEHSFRAAAAEARLDALEAQVAALLAPAREA
jgi:hypothetical protein